MKPPKRNSVERSPAFFRRAPRSKSDSKKVRCSPPTIQRRSGEMFIIGAGVHFVFSSELREMPGISRNSEERKGKSLLIYKHSVPTALFPSFLNPQISYFDIRSIGAGRGTCFTGFCSSSFIASCTARSSCGSCPLITSAGVYSTSISGGTPSFSTAHLPDRS